MRYSKYMEILSGIWYNSKKKIRYAWSPAAHAGREGSAVKVEERKIRTITAYQGVILRVRLDSAELPDGSTAVREVAEHPGGAAILPLDADGTVWCVRQYRYPFGQTLLEIPAGKLEPGEDPQACAERELSEETGLTADEVIPLGAQYSSPGYLQEVLHLYLARGLHRGSAHPDRGEFLNVEKHPLGELVQLAMTGALPDAKTTITVLKTKRLLEQG